MEIVTIQKLIDWLVEKKIEHGDLPVTKFNSDGSYEVVPIEGIRLQVDEKGVKPK